VLVAIFTTAWQLSSFVQIDPRQLSLLETASINNIESSPAAHSNPDSEEIEVSFVSEQASQLADFSSNVVTGTD